MNIQLLPDKGERLLKQVQDLEAALNALNISPADTTEEGTAHFFISFFFFFPELCKIVCLTVEEI